MPGTGLELDAIAAVVIGGTSLMGGRGSMIGTLVGVLIFGFLSNILQLNNIDSNTQLVLKGVDHHHRRSCSRNGVPADGCSFCRNSGRAMRSTNPCPIKSRIGSGTGRLIAQQVKHKGREKMSINRRQFAKWAMATALIAPLAFNASVAGAKDKYVIGFSQTTTVEPWRVQFNKDLEAEAKKHANVELLVADGQDKTEKQVADVENFIRQEVDAILISPKEFAGLTGVVEKAMDAGIPVIVLDRNVDTEKYTQWIGGDNVVIGEAAGKYAVELLGGKGKAKGTVVEIWGGLGTQASHDRSNGFHKNTDAEPGIKYLLDKQSGDWKQDQAYNIMATALRNHEDITLVYGHNDPMAYGAYLAAKDAGREKNILFIGVDGLPNEGVQWVNKGELAATFLYPTPGAEGLRQALKVLAGEKVEKKIVLDTQAITKENAPEILKANGLQ